MNVQDYLISTHGLSAEEAKVIADNPKYAGVYEKLAKEAEDGKTALLRAGETKAALEKWNQTEVIPYVQKADNAVASERAKNAAMVAHMKSLKQAGYEIPDAYLDGSSDPAPVITKPTETQPVKSDEMLNYAKANMALISMSNKYRSLTGNELDPEMEYEDFGKNARPNENLRTYITRKYDLSTIETKRTADAEQKKLDDYAATKVAAEKAEWAKSHGTNPDTLIPRASRFDKVVEARKADGSADKDGRPLWQTQAGREQARKNRLDKYSGLIN